MHTSWIVVGEQFDFVGLGELGHLGRHRTAGLEVDLVEVRLDLGGAVEEVDQFSSVQIADADLEQFGLALQHRPERLDQLQTGLLFVRRERERKRVDLVHRKLLLHKLNRVLQFVGVVVEEEHLDVHLVVRSIDLLAILQ